MLQLFLDRLDPWRLCDREESISGEIALSNFARIAPLLANQEGQVVANLRLYRGENQRGHIDGRVEAVLNLRCQRCLEAAQFSIDASFALLLTRGPEESSQVPADVDYLLLENDAQIVLRDLIEDELLLAIPDAPRHEQINCIDTDDFDLAETDLVDTVADDESNPFAILETLKKK